MQLLVVHEASCILLAGIGRQYELVEHHEAHVHQHQIAAVVADMFAEHFDDVAGAHVGARLRGSAGRRGQFPLSPLPLSDRRDLVAT